MSAAAKPQPGRRPDLAWLPVDRCTVDASYQRTLESRRSQALIERITERFSWACFQAVLAVRQGGDFIILDGQHRVEAARRLGLAAVPGVVVSAASVAEQAAAFVQANLDRVAVNPFALHHARIVAGDENACLVHRVCRAAGVEIPKYPIPADKLKPGQTLALMTIARLARLAGEDAAATVLRTIAAAYAKIPGAIRASLITALGRLYDETAPAQRPARFKQIAEWLKTQNPDELHARAIKRKASYGATETIALVYLIGHATLPTPGAAAAVPGSTIKPLTKAQMMGRR